MRPNHARVVGDPDGDPVAADERSDMSCGIANVGAGIPGWWREPRARGFAEHDDDSVGGELRDASAESKAARVVARARASAAAAAATAAPRGAVSAGVIAIATPTSTCSPLPCEDVVWDVVWDVV